MNISQPQPGFQRGATTGPNRRSGGPRSLRCARIASRPGVRRAGLPARRALWPESASGRTRIPALPGHRATTKLARGWASSAARPLARITARAAPDSGAARASPRERARNGRASSAARPPARIAAGRPRIPALRGHRAATALAAGWASGAARPPARIAVRADSDSGVARASRRGRACGRPGLRPRPGVQRVCIRPGLGPQHRRGTGGTPARPAQAGFGAQFRRRRPLAIQGLRRH